jgi:hypothetical protein
MGNESYRDGFLALFEEAPCGIICVDLNEEIRG